MLFITMGQARMIEMDGGAGRQGEQERTMNKIIPLCCRTLASILLLGNKENKASDLGTSTIQSVTNLYIKIKNSYNTY